MDLTLIWQALPYVIVFLIGLLPSLPLIGKYFIYLRGIPQIIAKYSPDIRAAVANDKNIKKETADAIFKLLNWVEKLVEITPLQTSAKKTEATLKDVSEKLGGKSK